MTLHAIIGLAALTYIIALFVPFDWWQKRPSRQPDTFIARWLGRFLDVSLRNLTIRACFLTMSFLAGLIFLPVFLTVFLPMMAIGLLVLHLSLRLFSRTSPPEVPLLGILLIVVVLWVTTIGLAAPLKALAMAAYFLLGRPAGGALEAFAAAGPGGVSFDLLVGSAGFAIVALWLYRDALWRFRQASQVENLPTSKARSVALGLVELRGVAQSEGSGPGPIIELSWDMFDYLQPRQTLRPFYLQDKTGRVLVDPTECRVRAGWITDVFSLFGCREIVLKRRVEKDDSYDSITRTLMPGDPVYLIGNAEINPKAPPDAVDSDRLVIRPAAQSSWSLSLWRFLFGQVTPAKGRSIFNVFFLADKDEASARSLILSGMHTVRAIGCLWLASSTVLLWFALHPISPSPDSWRAAYWAGKPPEPFMRDERFHRFEQYMKGVGRQSREAIPAVLEALRYQDLRYRERAAGALIRLLPAFREQAKAAVPLLIETLTISRNPDYVQTSIIALGEFGPFAAPAIPQLIDLLQDRDFVLRFQAAIALGELRAEAAVPALLKAREDPNVNIRGVALDALRKIRGR